MYEILIENKTLLILEILIVCEHEHKLEAFTSKIYFRIIDPELILLSF